MVVMVEEQEECLPDALRTMALRIAGLLMALVPLGALVAAPAAPRPDVNEANALAIIDVSTPPFGAVALSAAPNEKDDATDGRMGLPSTTASPRFTCFFLFFFL